MIMKIQDKLVWSDKMEEIFSHLVATNSLMKCHGGSSDVKNKKEVYVGGIRPNTATSLCLLALAFDNLVNYLCKILCLNGYRICLV